MVVVAVVVVVTVLCEVNFIDLVVRGCRVVVREVAVVTLSDQLVVRESFPDAQQQHT